MGAALSSFAKTSYRTIQSFQEVNVTILGENVNRDCFCGRLWYNLLLMDPLTMTTMVLLCICISGVGLV